MVALRKSSIAIVLCALFAIVLCATINAYPAFGVVAGQTYPITYSPENQAVSESERLRIYFLITMTGPFRST
jgi:hypothetical protein